LVSSGPFFLRLLRLLLILVHLLLLALLLLAPLLLAPLLLVLRLVSSVSPISSAVLGMAVF
jgi:hypothetical protein